MTEIRCPRCKQKLAETTAVGVKIKANGITYSIKPGVEVEVTCKCTRPDVIKAS